MNWEYSCGAVAYTMKTGEPLYVIVQEMEGAYSFPKGHMEGNETEIETARREVFEEIGLRPVFQEGFRETDEYDLAEKPGTRKRVTYFLADIGEEQPVAKPGEIRNVRLMRFEEALPCFNHEGTQRVLSTAHRILTEEQGKADD